MSKKRNKIKNKGVFVLEDQVVLKKSIKIDETNLEDYSLKSNKTIYNKYSKDHNRQRVKRKLKNYEIDINYELDIDELQNLME